MISVIGYGNSLRRDDGAGLVLAERLKRAWKTRDADIRWITAHQLTPELAEDIAREGVSAVVFLDTAVSTPGAARLRAQLCPLEANASPQSIGHHLDPGALMAYACSVYGKAPLAWMLTVPGTDFGYGEGLSRSTREALAGAEDLVSDLLARLLLATPDLYSDSNGVSGCDST